MPSRSRNRTPTGSYRAAVELRDLAGVCEAFPDALVDEALPKIGAMMKARALDHANAATGGDGRLSRMGRRGVKLGAGYDTVAPTVVRLTPRPLGAWTLVESGSHRSWWYEPRAGKPTKANLRRRRRRRLRLRNGAVRWYVRHTAVRGRQAWTRARRDIVDELPAVVRTAIVTAWAELR